jgi:hypothetical protein
MRAKAGMLILLGLFLITGTVSAVIADSSSTISTSREWLVANNYDASVISVVAKNLSSGTTVPGVVVSFTLDDPVYGIVTQSLVTTNALGVANTSFMTKTKSGTAVITAVITSNDNGVAYTTVISVNQQIDHHLAQTVAFDNPAKLPVGSIGNLSITLKDRYGNLIDNRNPSEHHTFFVYMPFGGNGWGLWDGSAFAFARQVETDAYGNASVLFKIANVPIPNHIFMDPIGNIVNGPDTETWIQGVSLEAPFSIKQDHPSPDDIAADGVEQFGLYYYVYDQYGNPANNTWITITASDGTSFSQLSNDLGSVFTTFGPKDTSGSYTINATVANTSVVCLSTGEIGQCSQVLKFHNTDPVDLILTANPLGMASRDASPTSSGTITAKVVDVKGNLVPGESVLFSLGPSTTTYSGGQYNTSGLPPASISAPSATTGLDGVATIYFTPGSFVSWDSPDYNSTATGTATVTATWVNRSGTTISRDVTFIWKNYPYVGITVPTDACKDAKVGDKINITVSLFGDGAALRPKPIDVVLVTDVSGSMAGQKIIDAKNAGKIFGASMSAQDRVGLESFGWNAPAPWGVKAQDDLPLTLATTAGKNTVNTTIDTYAAVGNTPMRPAIYNSTLLIKNNPRTGAVKAIVLMTDGQWNTCGDPQGISTSYTRMAWFSPQDPVAANQSVVTFAKNNGIKIYTVGLGAGANAAELQAYATETQGKYYFAPNSSQLAGIYTQIAGDLQETAGGNTVVSMNFGTVTINDIVGGGSVTDYMSYVANVSSPSKPTDSTYLNKTNLTPSGTMYFQSGYPYSLDQTAAWNAHVMSFNVGEIKLNESWSASFRLNLTQAGKITLFGPNSPTPSEIAFTDASTGVTTHQIIPPFDCAIQQQKINVPFGNKTIRIDNLTITPSAADANILSVKWNTTYNGQETVQETVLYQNTDIANSHAIPVPGGIVFESNCIEKTHAPVTIDATSWAPGHYSIKVVGTALDAANPGSDEKPWTKPGPTAPKYIKLE